MKFWALKTTHIDGDEETELFLTFCNDRRVWQADPWAAHLWESEALARAHALSEQQEVVLMSEGDDD